MYPEEYVNGFGNKRPQEEMHFPDRGAGYRIKAVQQGSLHKQDPLLRGEATEAVHRGSAR